MTSPHLHSWRNLWTNPKFAYRKCYTPVLDEPFSSSIPYFLFFFASFNCHELCEKYNSGWDPKKKFDFFCFVILCSHIKPSYLLNSFWVEKIYEFCHFWLFFPHCLVCRKFRESDSELNAFFIILLKVAKIKSLSASSPFYNAVLFDF